MGSTVPTQPQFQSQPDHDQPASPAPAVLSSRQTLFDSAVRLLQRLLGLAGLVQALRPQQVQRDLRVLRGDLLREGGRRQRLRPVAQAVRWGVGRGGGERCRPCTELRRWTGSALNCAVGPSGRGYSDRARGRAACADRTSSLRRKAEIKQTKPPRAACPGRHATRGQGGCLCWAMALLISTVGSLGFSFRTRSHSSTMLLGAGRPSLPCPTLSGRGGWGMRWSTRWGWSGKWMYTLRWVLCFREGKAKTKRGRQRHRKKYKKDGQKPNDHNQRDGVGNEKRRSRTGSRPPNGRGFSGSSHRGGLGRNHWRWGARSGSPRNDSAVVERTAPTSGRRALQRLQATWLGCS